MKKYLSLLAFCVVSIYAAASPNFVTHCKITTYKAADGQKTKDETVVCNKKVKAGTQNIVAVSRDLLWAIPLGSIIEIEGHGKYEVKDTTAEGIGHTIDILVHKDADTWMEKGVKVKVIKQGNKKK